MFKPWRKHHGALSNETSTTGDVPPLASGWMQKEGHVHRNWTRRYFALYADPFRIYYWESSNQANADGKDAKGVVELTRSRGLIVEDGIIKLATKHRNWSFKDAGDANTQYWIDHIRPIVDEVTKPAGDYMWEDISGNASDILSAEFYVSLGTWEATVKIQSKLREFLVQRRIAAQIQQNVEQQLHASSIVIATVMLAHVARIKSNARRKAVLRIQSGARKHIAIKTTHQRRKVDHQWKTFLSPSEHVIMCGTVLKQGPHGNLGRKNKRILLLTTHQRLIYIDTTKTPWEMKGEIAFTRLLSVSHKLETVVLQTTGRTYVWDCIASELNFVDGSTRSSKASNNSRPDPTLYGVVIDPTAEMWAEKLSRVANRNQSTTISRVGYLEKKAMSGKGKLLPFKKRFFVLDGNLLIYRTDESATRNKGEISLTRDSFVKATSIRKFSFELVTPQMIVNREKLVCAASTEKDRDDWIAVIKAAILR